MAPNNSYHITSSTSTAFLREPTSSLPTKHWSRKALMRWSKESKTYKANARSTSLVDPIPLFQSSISFLTALVGSKCLRTTRIRESQKPKLRSNIRTTLLSSLPVAARISWAHRNLKRVRRGISWRRQIKGSIAIGLIRMVRRTHSIWDPKDTRWSSARIARIATWDSITRSWRSALAGSNATAWEIHTFLLLRGSSATLTSNLHQIRERQICRGPSSMAKTMYRLSIESKSKCTLATCSKQLRRCTRATIQNWT